MVGEDTHHEQPIGLCPHRLKSKQEILTNLFK